ncbi:hypothetical protein ABZS95_10320 [Streptomyces sp. NPDC005479]
MRSAILAAAVTALFALVAIGAYALLAGLDAARATTTPTPSPNAAPEDR